MQRLVRNILLTIILFSCVACEKEDGARTAPATPPPDNTAVEIERPFGVVPAQPNAGHIDAMVASERAPFYPSRLETGGTPVSVDMFDPPELCGGCHADIYDQWKGSMHSSAWKDPVYRALLKKTSDATNGKADNFCMGCHTPIGVVTGEAKVSGEGMSELAEQGVQCDFCHNISGATGIGNGSAVVTPKRDGRPLKFGPFDDAISSFHDTTYSELHTKSALCGNCHNVTHPFNNLPVERTYDEWRDSEYAAKGVECQHCHMTRGKTQFQANPGVAAAGGKSRPHIWTHYFVGGNAAVTRHLGNDTHAELAEAMLKSAATIEILGEPRVEKNQVQVTVRVTNSGAGHKLPTGFPEGREMWVDFKVTDARGKEIYRLGQVKDGQTEAGTKNFKVHVANDDGRVLHYEIWEATRLIQDNRLNPKAYADLEYRFKTPKSAKMPLKIVANLNYWSFPPKLLEEIMGAAAPHIPVIQMASVAAEHGAAPRTGRRNTTPHKKTRGRKAAANR